MSGNTTYLITGAARGLGKGFVQTFLARPNTTVIAAVRNTSSATANDLKSLPVGEASQLIIVQIDSKTPSDAQAAIDLLKSDHQINHLDVVIANAGISEDMANVATVTLKSIEDHFAVNSIAPLALFQAGLPLLEKAQKPQFLIVGSAMGSIGGMDQRAQYPLYAYGASKAVAHFTARKIHYAHENIIAYVVDPGFTQTDMGNSGARAVGLEKAYIEVDVCVGGMVSIVDKATKAETSGRNCTWDGTEFPW